MAFCPYLAVMFTGIIESTGIIRSVTQSGSNRVFHIQSPLGPSLRVDQSLAHEGVCLTVEAISGDVHQVTAIAETLEKTNLSQWAAGKPVNLERSLTLESRLDGHIVQGHVDATGTCVSREEKNGSWEFRISFPASFAALVIEKGSIALNGTSLTCFAVNRDAFSVAIIPYTFQHTSIHQLMPGQSVNLEFDMLGKYVQRKLAVGR